MPKKDIKGIVAYYVFWGWEYLRRNPEYIADSKVIIEMMNLQLDKLRFGKTEENQQVPNLLEAELEFLKKYKCKPTDHDIGMSADQLLVEMEKSWDDNKTFDPIALYNMLRQKNKFDYFKLSAVSYRYGEGTKEIGHSENDLGFKKFVDMVVGKQTTSSKLSIEIDLNDDIELILKEIRYRYYHSVREYLMGFSEPIYIDNIASPEEPKQPKTLRSFTETTNIKEREFLAWMDREEWWWSKIKAGLRFPIKSRAYGLWMWDYCYINKCKPGEALKAFMDRIKKEEIRFGKNKEAQEKEIKTYNKYYKKQKTLNTNTDEAHYHIDLEGSDSVENKKRIYTCLRMAEKCIHEGQVISMK